MGQSCAVKPALWTVLVLNILCLVQSLVRTDNVVEHMGSAQDAVEYTFPETFAFGTSTASYQIEGAWNVSGKGESIWDRASHTEGGIMKTHDTGDVACDSYHKYKEDVQLVKNLGVSFYRFSLSWSRLLPTGAIDKINEDGIRYYKAVLTELLQNGIEPMVTIFHWDLPQPLQDIGGWPNEALVDYFVDYADFVFNTFGDQVRFWQTFNEPHDICFRGYGQGIHAPGFKEIGRADYLCTHTILKAHGRSYRLYQDKYASKQKGKISISNIAHHFEPKNASSIEDQEAAERSYEFFLGIYTHPIFSDEGDYPQVVKDYVLSNSLAQGLKRSRLPSFSTQEIEMIKGSADFIGINHYTTQLATQLNSSVIAQHSRAYDSQALTYLDPNAPSTFDGSFRIVPSGFRKLLVWLRDHYNNTEVFITELGTPDPGTSLRDTERVSFYQKYLKALLEAIYVDKCKVTGLNTWSLMDNFEWSDGFRPKFGLYYVDFADPDLPRIPKMSAKFFQLLTKTRRIPKTEDIDFPDDSTTTGYSHSGTMKIDTTATLLIVFSLIYHWLR